MDTTTLIWLLLHPQYTRKNKASTVPFRNETPEFLLEKKLQLLCEVCNFCASLLLTQLTQFNRLFNSLHFSTFPLDSKCFVILHKQTSVRFTADLSFLILEPWHWTQKPEHHRVSSKPCVTHIHQSGSLEGALIAGREPVGLDTSSPSLSILYKKADFTFTSPPVGQCFPGLYHQTFKISKGKDKGLSRLHPIQ